MNEKSLLKAILRSRLVARLIKETDAYKALYDELRQSFTHAWDEASAEALTASLDRMRELGPGRFTEADKRQIITTLEKKLGGEAMVARLRQPALDLGEALFRAGATEVGKAVGVDIAFGRPDLDALDVLGEGNLYWIQNSWNAETHDIFNAALSDYFEEGMTRQQLTERFADDFAGFTHRGQRYWELLADHTATRTREMGRVTGYERAGVEYVQVRARIDAHTSRICLGMHGRVILVSRLSAQRASYLKAVKQKNAPAAKEAWVMHPNSASDEIQSTATSALDKGTASPPYHFRCRTITVAYLKERTALTETYNREPLSKDEVKEIVARMESATWSSSESAHAHYEKHGKPYKDKKAYLSAAGELIKKSDRDIYLAVRDQKLKALFVEKRSPSSVNFCVVDVESNTIETLHIRSPKRLSARSDEVQALLQPRTELGKGRWWR